MLPLEATHVMAGCVLGALGTAVSAWLIVLLRRLPYTTAQSAVWLFVYVVARVVWRARTAGRFPLQRAQGAVIVSNHRGPVDPAFVQLTLDRVVHWMVAQEYLEIAAFRWFFWLAEMFPVSRRGIDTAGTRRAIRFCQEGGLVGVFPEGRLNTTNELLLPGRPGAALIALKARVPVVPYYVSGTPHLEPAWKNLFMPANARVKVGRPIDVSEFYGRENEREVLEEVTRRFLREIAKMAGADHFEPRLAGRFYRPRTTGQETPRSRS